MNYATGEPVAEDVYKRQYLHWWEFIGAYSSIGRGLFATVVGIRSKRIKGQKLEKYEQEFVRDNPDLRCV